MSAAVQSHERDMKTTDGEHDAANAIPYEESRPLAQRLRRPLMIAGPVLVLLIAGYFYLFGGRYFMSGLTTGAVK